MVAPSAYLAHLSCQVEQPGARAVTALCQKPQKEAELVHIHLSSKALQSPELLHLLCTWYHSTAGFAPPAAM